MDAEAEGIGRKVLKEGRFGTCEADSVGDACRYQMLGDAHLQGLDDDRRRLGC